MRLAATLVARVLVLLLALSAMVGQVAHLDALSGVSLGLAGTLVGNPTPSFLTLVAADAVVSVSSGVLAIALVFRGDPNRGARGLAVTLAAWSYLLAYSGIVVLLRPDPGALRTIFQAHFPLVELLGLAGMIRFTSIFPHKLTKEELSPRESLPIGLRTLQAARSHLLTLQAARSHLLSPAAPWIAVVLLLAVLLSMNALVGRSLADVGLNPLMDLVRFMAVGMVVLNLRRSWLAGGAGERADIWWMLVGLALLTAAITLLIGGNVLVSATGWSEPPIAWRPIVLDLGLLGFLWGLSMAVFYTGTIDSAASARRVVALTALALIGLLVATGLETLLSGALVARMSMRPGLGTALAAVVMTVSYPRTLALIERLLDQIPGVDEEEVSAV